MDATTSLVSPGPRAGLREDLNGLGEEVAARRFTGHSPDGSVAATVTGDGDLLDLAVENRALRGSDSVAIGAAIVRAVLAARSDAGRFTWERTRAILHGGSASLHSGAAAPSARARDRGVVRRPAPDEDDLFQGFGGGTR